jgi:hypothetical protein
MGVTSKMVRTGTKTAYQLTYFPKVQQSKLLRKIISEKKHYFVTKFVKKSQFYRFISNKMLFKPKNAEKRSGR